MKKYLIYLTKSAEVATRIMMTFNAGSDGVEEVEQSAGNNLAIPAVYLDQGYFYCIIKYAENADVEPYRLVIA